MANKFGGGFGGNMQQLMKQAQMMQQKIAEAQQELEDTEITGSSGGGLVTVTMNGKSKILGISIKSEAIDPEDPEMLEDLIMAAIGDASTQADELYQEIMGPYASAGGLF